MSSGLFLGDAAARLRASVVAIVDGGHGAGFAWRDDLFVTSAHVVSSRKAVVLTPDGRTFVSTASLTMAPDVQLADLVYEPGPAPHSMVLHNCSRDGRSSADVHSVQIFPVEAVTLRPLDMKNDVRNRR